MSDPRRYNAWEGIANYSFGNDMPDDTLVRLANAEALRAEWLAENEKGRAAQAVVREANRALKETTEAEAVGDATANDVAKARRQVAKANAALAKQTAASRAALIAFDEAVQAYRRGDRSELLSTAQATAADAQARATKAYAELTAALPERETAFKLAGWDPKASGTWRSRQPFAFAVSPDSALRELLDQLGTVVNEFPEDLTAKHTSENGEIVDPKTGEREIPDALKRRMARGLVIR